MSSPIIKIKTEFYSSSLYRNEKYLRQKYVVEGVSARQIALLLHCSHDAVNRALNKFSIPKKRPQSGPSIFGQKLKNGRRIPHIREMLVIRRVLKLHESGKTPSEIADALNKNGQTKPRRLLQWNRYAVQRILNRDRKRGHKA